jgi:4,5-DOPA dioxygenase extradiol
MSGHHFNPVFIGHGSPMNAVADNRYTRFLRDYAQSIPRPEAILVVSAHWQTDGARITAGARPGQIYDFYGFPDELYALNYAPDGQAALARSISGRVPEIQGDEHRGIDHAGWAVVKHMYPDGNVPLLELSLDYGSSEFDHFELGKKLAFLADEGVLVIGSGNIVHNLRFVDVSDGATPFPWAQSADAWISEQVTRGNPGELIEYQQYMPDYRQAIPTSEHYLPLLYILGMATGAESAKTIFAEIQNGSVSMRSFELQ